MIFIEGKATRLHNFTTTGINLDSVQQSGKTGWWVDSLSVTSFPHMMNPGDSEYVHVRFPIPVYMNTPVYWIDTMNVVSELGTHRVIIMINSELYDGIPAVSGKEKSLLIYNYPNPFTGSTVIHYQLPERTNVKLEILNMLGKEVATLVNSEQACRCSTMSLSMQEISLQGFITWRLLPIRKPSQKRCC